MPKLTINGTEIEVEPGTSVLQAAEQIGVEIPRFCYHDRLSVPANCRMCLVEVKGGPPKPAASCALACAEGMEVETDSPMVHKARQGVMEFLLINHPLDCPICDQGGECDLQDQAVGYGYDRSRYTEAKRSVQDKELGPLVKTVMTRCIQCTRCVRFDDEIAGCGELGLMNRGEDVEIDTFTGQPLTSELSGNLIDICPVGALTSKPYAFTARPWELDKCESIDVSDAVGSNIMLHSRGREVMRVLPRLNEDINEEWIHDKARFSADGLKVRRLDRPYLRKGGKLQAVDWREALQALNEQVKPVKGSKIAALAGDLCAVEDVVALKDMMGKMASKNIECRVDGADFDVENRASWLFNAQIAGIDQADAILLLGVNPRAEAAMVNARIRRNWLERKVPIASIGDVWNSNYPVESLGDRPSDIQKLMKSRTGFAKILKDAKNPMVIIGAGAFQRKDGGAIQALAMALAEKFKMVRDGWNGFNVLHQAAGRVGALEVGFTPAKPFNLAKMDVVWLLNVDTDIIDKIAPDAFLVYQGHHGDLAAHRADLILPGVAYSEKDGLYMNTEGRVQMARKAVSAPGHAKEDWKIIRAFSEVYGKTLPYNSLSELRKRITDEWAHINPHHDVLPALWADIPVLDSASLDQDTAFETSIVDFYQTNVIARASEAMAQCSSTYVDREKLLEAAE